MQKWVTTATNAIDSEDAKLVEQVLIEPFSGWIPVLGTYAHSADPVQMLQNAASAQGLHCLLTGISM